MRTPTPEVSSPALTATVGELDAAPAARAANVERPAGLTLSDELIQDIRNMPPLSRPDPKTYIAPEAIAEHLGHFDEGAARYMTETNLQKYGIGQRDGTAFVIPAAEANALEAAAARSATKLEKALACQIDCCKTTIWCGSISRGRVSWTCGCPAATKP